MPPSGSQRTRAKAPSQSQARAKSQRRQPRGSQARRQTQAHDESEDEGHNDDDDAENDAGMDVDEDSSQGADGDLARKAADLVRLAIFNENKRTPLRREEISKKVMGSNTRAFNRVFELAQGILHKSFGMELVELQSRADIDREEYENEDGGTQTQDASQRGKKKKAATGSKTYILRSTLDQILIDQASQAFPDLLEAERQDAVDDEEITAPTTHGSIIAWNNCDEVGAIGILYVILGLILVSGRILGDAQLRTYLKQLKLPIAGGQFSLSERSSHSSMNIDAYLSQLIRQGYLDRREAGETKKGGKGKNKRTRVGEEEDPNLNYEWRWGNRAQSEVGENDIARFIASFLAGDEDEEEDERGHASSSRRGRKQQAESKFDKLMKGVQRAAGGELAAAR
ncbi:hypothetical protein ONZ45_g7134 [Pleurotus djamor]|nr:hypothetical protein ONZ45_g7134 [Pleurotus djamor]